MMLVYDVEGQSFEDDDFDLNQIVSLIHQMDGDKRTELHISMDEMTCLSIGGGCENEYVVSFAFNIDEYLFQLTNGMKTIDNQFVEKKILVGGQLIEYSTEFLVGIEKVEIAVEYYYSNRAMDTNLDWKQEF